MSHYELLDWGSDGGTYNHDDTDAVALDDTYSITMNGNSSQFPNFHLLKHTDSTCQQVDEYVDTEVNVEGYNQKVNSATRANIARLNETHAIYWGAAYNGANTKMWARVLSIDTATDTIVPGAYVTVYEGPRASGPRTGVIETASIDFADTSDGIIVFAGYTTNESYACTFTVSGTTITLGSLDSWRASRSAIQGSAALNASGSYVLVSSDAATGEAVLIRIESGTWSNSEHMFNADAARQASACNVGAGKVGVVYGEGASGTVIKALTADDDGGTGLTLSSQVTLFDSADSATLEAQGDSFISRWGTSDKTLVTQSVWNTTDWGWVDMYAWDVDHSSGATATEGEVIYPTTAPSSYSAEGYHVHATRPSSSTTMVYSGEDADDDGVTYPWYGILSKTEAVPTEFVLTETGFILTKAHPWEYRRSSV